MKQTTWSSLIAVLRHIANSEEPQESDLALELFAEILSMRAFDTSTVMALLAPVPQTDLKAEGERMHTT